MNRRLLLGIAAAILFLGGAAAPCAAATLYGGGSSSSSSDSPVPLFLVAVDAGHASIVGLSGGACSNGRTAFGHFQTHPFRLHRHGRFRLLGHFALTVPGAVAKGSYRIKGRVRARQGLASGVASVRIGFPDPSAGKTITCAGKRRFRARNPASHAPAHSRGPFYGVTSQGLPVVVREAPDRSALAPVALFGTLSCNALGAVDATARLLVPATAPGTFAKSGHVTSNFVPALGSTVSIPVGTYTYDPYSFQAQVANGRATGTINFSGQVGNAQKVLIDTCAAPPITFTALP